MYVSLCLSFLFMYRKIFVRVYSKVISVKTLTEECKLYDIYRNNSHIDVVVKSTDAS